MTDINQLSRWNRDISKAIATLGTADFFPNVVSAVNGQVPIDYPQIWLYHRDLPPRVLYHEIPEDEIDSQIGEYLEGPYRENPCSIVGEILFVEGEGHIAGGDGVMAASVRLMIQSRILSRQCQ